MKDLKITGVILAGGKNSRMGSDKGLLEVDGIKIIERIIDAMKPIVDRIIIISNGNNYDYLGYSVYKDLVRDCGPMGGIYTALHYAQTDRIFVVSCDMPFISRNIITSLIHEANGVDIVVPEHSGGKTEPLCALYSKYCFSKLAELLKSGNWKMKDALTGFNVKKISIPENSFMNINTPAEYQTIKKIQNEYSH